MSDEQRIYRSAVELLRVLETPIAGVPSVTVQNREIALRLIAAGFRAVYDGVKEQLDGDGASS